MVQPNTSVINCVEGTGTSLITIQQKSVCSESRSQIAFSPQSSVLFLHDIDHTGERQWSVKRSAQIYHHVWKNCQTPSLSL